MADSAALRVRRSRLHKKGDHSLCDPARCASTVADTSVTTSDPALAVPTSSPSDSKPAESTDAGGIETMARLFVDSLPYPPTDPRAMLGEIAVMLARRVDQDGAVPAAVRELRTLLMQLAEAPNGPAGAVDEARLKSAQRKIDGLLALGQSA